MKTARFIAADAASALAQIQERLGPEAVVLSVRPRGVSRLWSRSGRIEVTAGLPDNPAVDLPPTDTAPANSSCGSSGTSSMHGSPVEPISTPGRWQSIGWLTAMGLLPEHAARLQRQMDSEHSSAPSSLEEEWTLVNAALLGRWNPPPPIGDLSPPRPHVFIGPPGSGKTTVLCKWLTLAVLTEGKPAQVWRLDAGSANTADFLSIHCEMLGAPIARFWSPPADPCALQFIDLPGVEAHDAQGLAALRDQLAALPRPHVHLVLNAAYETSALLAQWRAFAALNPDDLVFTHLDEETRRVKLWNFVLGVPCGIRFLSAGQKVPGEFSGAAPALLFPA